MEDLVPPMPLIGEPITLAQIKMTPKRPGAQVRHSKDTLLEDIKADAEKFKENFGSYDRLEDEKRVIQAQLVKIMRREAITEHNINVKIGNIHELTNRLVTEEKKVDVLKQKVINNTGRLNEHSQVIHEQGNTIDNIAEKLDDLKISNEQQVMRTETQQDIILAEVRKGNEVILGQKENETKRAQLVHDEFPSLPPNNT